MSENPQTIDVPLPTPPSAEKISDEKINRALAAASGAFEAQKLTDLECLDVLIRVAIPILARYPRLMENSFFKTLEKNLKVWRRMAMKKAPAIPEKING